MYWTFYFLILTLPHQMFSLGVSTSRFGSGLCPTRNRPDDIGFLARKPVTNRKHQRVRSDRSCLIGGRIGWSRLWCYWRFHFDGDLYFSPDLRRICAKITRSKQKNIKSSPDFCKTHEIWAKIHQIVAGIFKKFTRICKNPVDLHQKSPKSAWISSNLTGSHQIWSRSRLDLLECRWISPNLAWISPNIAGFVYNVGRVGWLGFWRRKPATWPAGVGSWARKPVTDRRSGRFGRLPVRVQAGWSGWSGFELGWHP